MNKSWQRSKQNLNYAAACGKNKVRSIWQFQHIKQKQMTDKRTEMTYK